MWDRRAKITAVKDGDTVKAYEDCGKSEFQETDIRLFGTFAPEKNEPGGAETKEFAAEWVKKHSTSDWPFVITYMRNRANTNEQMTFGRYVCMVQAVDTGEYLNTAVSAFVIANGYGGGIGS